MSEPTKRAWEIARELYENARPVIRSEKEQTWEENTDTSAFYDQNLSLDWGSNVPGSGAPEKIMVAAVAALENRGWLVSEAGYQYLFDGLAAYDRKDFPALHRASALLRRELANARKDPSSEYWRFRYYSDYEQYAAAVSFPPAMRVDTAAPRFRDQVMAGWSAQLVGAAMGTIVEGYTSRKLYETFGEVRDYLREPNTYNDDITYELAFLDAFSHKGYAVTAEDIALSWVALIPCGWSAEEIAIRNLKRGIFPPESGRLENPFNEWIGAQMRAGVCGMAAPGDPRMAASLAWKDGCVSHANNGILGEIFNAVLTSLSFVEPDVRKILREAMQLIPADSEYRSVIDFAFSCCEKYADWHQALAECEQKYIRYNWIHAYPNACCEVIALYYGEGDFEKTLRIITMCGIDADCNAGMIMPVIAIRQGFSSIPAKFLQPAFETITTYMRGSFRTIATADLADRTVRAVQNAAAGLSHS